MKVKTSEMTELQIDWAIAKCEEVFEKYYCTRHGKIENVKRFHPTTNWSQGGPLIDRMGESGLILMRATARQLGWRASLDFPNRFNFGPTSLIAAMRCYVASKLGDEVDIPEELV